MTDEQTQPQDGNVETPATPDASGAEAQDVGQLPSWAQKLVHDLRQEAAQHRKDKQAAREKADTEERTRLAEKEQWKELAAKLQADLEATKPQIEAAQAYRDTIAATVEARVKALPEGMRTLVPAFDDPAKTLQWLDANAAVLQTPRPPQMDAGVAGDGGKSLPKLTQEELDFAKMANMTPQQYAEWKAKSRPAAGDIPKP